MSHPQFEHRQTIIALKDLHRAIDAPGGWGQPPSSSSSRRQTFVAASLGGRVSHPQFEHQQTLIALKDLHRAIDAPGGWGQPPSSNSSREALADIAASMEGGCPTRSADVGSRPRLLRTAALHEFMQLCRDFAFCAIDRTQNDRHVQADGKRSR